MATVRQKRFARLVAGGTHPEDGSPLCATDAYALAGYACSTWSRNVQTVESSRLARHPVVASLIKEERKRLLRSEKRVQEAQETLILSDSARVLTKLRAWLDGAECSNSQIRAADLLARCAGMLKTDITIENKQRSSSEIETLLAAKLAAFSSEENENEIEREAGIIEELKTSDAVH